MTLYSAFSHSVAPGTATGSTGTQFIVGTAFEVTTGGNYLEGYWWYAGGATTAQKFTLWGITSGPSGGPNQPTKTAAVVANSTVTSGVLTANAWNYVSLPTPLPLAIGTSYQAATGYVITSPFANQNSVFSGAGITSGPLFVYSDSTGSNPNPWGWSQGNFTVGAGTDPTVAPPLATGGSGFYGLDVQISDTESSYAGPYSLWPNNLMANQATVADLDSQYVVATEFWLSAQCHVSAIRYFSPISAPTQASAVDIWSISTQSSVFNVTSPTWAGSSPGWLQTTANVTLPPGKYKVSVYDGNAAHTGGTGGTTKDATTLYFVSGKGQNGITWGPISAPNSANAAVGNLVPGPGTRTSTASWANPTTGPDQYPTNASSPDQNYWVDVLVTPVPVPDFAGAVDAVSVIVNVSVSDFAGAVETESPPVIGIFFNDFAGSVEGYSETVTAALVDIAGAVSSLVIPMSTSRIKTTVFAVNAYTTLNSSFTSQIAVGAPYQGNMAQLALDRWNYMYPS